MVLLLMLLCLTVLRSSLSLALASDQARTSLSRAPRTGRFPRDAAACMLAAKPWVCASRPCAACCILDRAFSPVRHEEGAPLHEPCCTIKGCELELRSGRMSELTIPDS